MDTAFLYKAIRDIENKGGELVYLEDLVAAFPGVPPKEIRNGLSQLLSSQQIFMREYDDGVGRVDQYLCSDIKLAHLQQGGGLGDPV